METIYKGQRYSVNFLDTYTLESDEGRHYCCGDGCSYCEEGTGNSDPHEFNVEFPKSSFVDDLGNRWNYAGIVRSDSSSSFGWWESTHRWALAKGGKKSGGFNPAEPLDIRKIRRRIEDRLRKIDSEAIIIAVAIKLGVSLA